MIIPDAAIEAAAKASWIFWSIPDVPTWDEAEESLRQYFIDDAAAQLRAAAPIIIADYLRQLVTQAEIETAANKPIDSGLWTTARTHLTQLANQLDPER